MKKLIAVSCFLLIGLSWQVGAFSEADLQKLKSSLQCPDCNLSGVDLSGAKLAGANLAYAN